MHSRSPSLSPPPLKRRRVTPPKASSVAPPPTSRIQLPNHALDARATTLRIYSWNINGIAPYLDAQQPITKFFSATPSSHKPDPSPSFPSLRACLHRWCFPHIIGLQEVKIAPTDTSSQASLRRIINSPLSDDDPTTDPSRLYDAHFCLPHDKHNATGFSGKLYGVCTLIRRDIAASSKMPSHPPSDLEPLIAATTPSIPRLHRHQPSMVQASHTRTVEWDLEGRVLITELPSLGIVVFNVYAVNGTANPYRDPSSGKVVGDRHMRKRIFHAEFRDECAEYEKQGWQVVVAGDLNISQTPLDSFPDLRMGKEHVRNREHFRECFIQGKEKGGLGMKDTFREIKGEERKFSYRPRGRVWGDGMDRVDLILASRGMKVRDADILDEELERGRSDHVPLWVEVEVGASEDEERKGKVKDDKD